MMRFFSENWGSLLVGIAVLAVVALVLIKMHRDRKKGENSCGCDCGNCPSAGMCHKK